jgi:uncharacterized protein (TIGR03067 family)
MAIVSCPECTKRLKVADTSVGKKVKCSCGKIFVAEMEEAAPVQADAATPVKVLVHCTECGAKLKVATASLGKKMKCPKCAAIFIAGAAEESATQASKKETERPPEPGDLDEETPNAKRNAAGDADIEDLLTFAQEDAKKSSEEEVRFEDEEEEVKPEAKAKPGKKAADDDEDLGIIASKTKARSSKKAELDDAFEEDEPPKAKSKIGQKVAKPPRLGEAGDADKKPVYPRRPILNLLVFLLLIVYITLFGLVFLEVFNFGFQKPRGRFSRAKIVPKQETEEDKKKREAAEANTAEAAKLAGTWTVDSAKADGNSLEEWKAGKFTFADGKTTIPRSKGGVFSIDASKDPKWIDITTDEKLTLLGIYQVDGDSLKLCTNITTKVVKDGKSVEQASERPTQFDSKQGMLFVLKRDKKKGDEKTKTARSQLKVLTEAVRTFAVKNSGRFPQSLDELFVGNPPYLEGKNALINPWGRPYHYDPSGPRNKHRHPDIWTVSPSTEEIGNWSKE